MADESIRPFSCGSQYSDWRASNCDRCAKSNNEGEGYRCDIEEAIDMAYFDDGTVSPEIARRMGHRKGPPFDYLWPCTEVDWTEGWKAEYRRLHPEATA